MSVLSKLKGKIRGIFTPPKQVVRVPSPTLAASSSKGSTPPELPTANPKSRAIPELSDTQVSRGSEELSIKERATANAAIRLEPTQNNSTSAPDFTWAGQGTGTDQMDILEISRRVEAQSRRYSPNLGEG